MTKEMNISDFFGRNSFKSLFARGSPSERVSHIRQGRMTLYGVHSHLKSFSIIVLNEK